ncbi:MAG TPA: hypothetical protein DF613_08975 [Lachnospiraceae bacterium]|nr:hypothetical protein [Lachnospiraceae bacterium]
MRKTVLCYGDSNTFGLMPDLQSRYPYSVRWTGRLQRELGEKYYVLEEGLGGRTTVWDDPVEMHKNGKTYLLPCLESHRPIDLVILMLGTNDLKERFHVSSFDVGQSIKNLLGCIKGSASGPDLASPEILLVCPVPIRDRGNIDLQRMLGAGFQKSLELDGYLAPLAEEMQVHYLNPGDRVEVSKTDGIHYTEQGHRVMTALMKEKVLEILGDR